MLDWKGSLKEWSGSDSTVCIDFETYWTDDYSLSRMSVEEYVSDPRFEVLCLGYWSRATGYGIAWGDDEIAGTLDRLRVWDGDVLTAAHNMAFDGYIANALYAPEGRGLGFPLCTCGMARFTEHGRRTKLTLQALAEYFGLPVKLKDLIDWRGLHASDLAPGDREDLETYCKRDVRILRKLCDILGQDCTGEALEFIALSLRMYIDPVLRLDAGGLERYRDELIRRQEEGLARLQRVFKAADRYEFLKMLRSRDAFVRMLRSLGAEPPVKESPALAKRVAAAEADAAGLLALHAERGLAPAERKSLARCRDVIREGSLTPALAKTDLGFIALMNSEDEQVSLLANLRAENNSSMAQSRAEAFLGVARRGGLLPVPLSPYRAHTGRYTAGNEGGGRSDRLNLQNLPKRTGDRSLRQAILAPEGCRLVAGDSSQIEARMGAWLAGQEDLVEIFRSGRDPYVDMAVGIFGGDYDAILRGAKAEGDPDCVFMRNVGKEVILSSQYGISGETFGRRLLQQGVRLAEADEGHYGEARRINALYRERYGEISNIWWRLNDAIKAACSPPDSGLAPEYEVRGLWAFEADGPLSITDAAGTLVVGFPNGFSLVYPEIEMDVGEGKASYLSVGGFSSKPVRKGIYGGLLFNNITQGMAFAVLAAQAVRLARRYRIVANVHDSWVILVRDDPAEVAEAEGFLLDTLRTPPEWAADLPLGAEVKSGYNYEVA
jgi:DNA polymerase